MGPLNSAASGATQASLRLDVEDAEGHKDADTPRPGPKRIRGGGTPPAAAENHPPQEKGGQRLRREIRVSFYLDSEEYEAFQIVCDTLEGSRSKILRAVVRRFIERAGRERKRDEASGQARLPL